MQEMRLFDRADGVKGHYCIGRQMTKYVAETWEFYNKGAWCSAGQIFTSLASAEFVMEKLIKKAAK